MDPQPSGDRSFIPPSLRTALGLGDDDGSQRAVLILENPREREIFRNVLEAEHWSVRILTGHTELPPNPIDILILDDMDLLMSLLTTFPGKAPTIFYISDDDELGVVEASLLGADWVIRRPIDPLNPMLEREQP